MELQSKKLMKALKDLDDINDADLDSSENPELQALTGSEIGKFHHEEKNSPKDKELN